MTEPPRVSPPVRVARHRRLGLRSSITLTFAGGALLLSAVLALGTYLVARDYLVLQRERVAASAGFADASYVRDGLLTQGRLVNDVLGDVGLPADGTVFVRDGAGEWYGSSLVLATDDLPPGLVESVAAGGAGVAWTEVDGDPAIAVGVAIPAVSAEFYEVTTVDELDGTLETLATVLTGFAALTTVGGALLGRRASRSALVPLDAIAGSSGRIAGGDLDTRLEPTDDPDLGTIVDSFNSMVDALQARIDRDARFNADVSHELRSPLTTLTTSVRVLEGRRDELSPVSRDALDLAVAELKRFRTVLDDLLELGRIDAGATAGVEDGSVVAADELVRQAVIGSGRSADLVVAETARDLMITADKQRLNRALVNLFDNADAHGGGLAAVHVRERAGMVVVDVDDRGAGVDEPDRLRVFERFVRTGSRGSRPGAGLGLSLVAETARAHHGTVVCTDAPGGGARFSLALPLAETDERVDA